MLLCPNQGIGMDSSEHSLTLSYNLGLLAWCVVKTAFDPWHEETDIQDLALKLQDRKPHNIIMRNIH
jgi:hypothetical protein